VVCFFVIGVFCGLPREFWMTWLEEHTGMAPCSPFGGGAELPEALDEPRTRFGLSTRSRASPPTSAIKYVAE
jgi:hypothetical protein